MMLGTAWMEFRGKSPDTGPLAGDWNPVPGCHQRQVSWESDLVRGAGTPASWRDGVLTRTASKNCQESKHKAHTMMSVRSSEAEVIGMG